MRPKVTKKDVEEDLRAVAADTLRIAYLDVSKAVSRAGGDSALLGLEIVATAFSMVIVTYAKPNALNPQGMCDDLKAFQQYFAQIIARGVDQWRAGTPPKARS